MKNETHSRHITFEKALRKYRYYLMLMLLIMFRELLGARAAVASSKVPTVRQSSESPRSFPSV